MGVQYGWPGQSWQPTLPVRRPLLVLLAACHGAGDGQGAEALTSLGSLLARSGVPAVVAMQGKVTMATMATMAPDLFGQLRRHGQVDRALAAARGAVLDRADWWIPVLFLRLRSGRIWAEPGPYDVPLGLRLPYRDLEPFTIAHADLFFGRTALIHEGLEKWRAGERRFLAIVGASGSGKSSLAQAGLLPRFSQDLRDLGMVPEIAIVRPGTRPLVALADELRRHRITERPDLALSLRHTPELLTEMCASGPRREPGACCCY
jgi:hypothetical protein